MTASATVPDELPAPMPRRAVVVSGVVVEDGVAVGVAVDDVLGEGGEFDVVGACVAAEGGEGLFWGGVGSARGEHAFCLFDDDAGVEGGLELFGEFLGVFDAALLEDADGGDVGECLAEV